MKTYLQSELKFRIDLISKGRSLLKPHDQDVIRKKCELFIENLSAVKHDNLKTWLLQNIDSLRLCIMPTHRVKFDEKVRETLNN